MSPPSSGRGGGKSNKKNEPKTSTQDGVSSTTSTSNSPSSTHGSKSSFIDSGLLNSIGGVSSSTSIDGGGGVGVSSLLNKDTLNNTNNSASFKAVELDPSAGLKSPGEEDFQQQQPLPFNPIAMMNYGWPQTVQAYSYPPAAPPVPQQNDTAMKGGSGKKKGSSNFEARNTKSFPETLYAVLSMPEYSTMIQWLSHGRGFIITDKKSFTNEVLPKYFEGAKFTSFTRRLKRWSFERVSKGPELGAYYNPYFVMDKPELVQHMRYHNRDSDDSQYRQQAMALPTIQSQPNKMSIPTPDLQGQGQGTQGGMPSNPDMNSLLMQQAILMQYNMMQQQQGMMLPIQNQANNNNQLAQMMMMQGQGINQSSILGAPQVHSGVLGMPAVQPVQNVPVALNKEESTPTKVGQTESV